MKRFISVFLSLALIAGFSALPPHVPAANAAADSLLIVDFEDGDTGGFIGHDGGKLTVTAETAHSGKNSLLVTGRTVSWNGPELRVDPHIEAGVIYEISVWVSHTISAHVSLTMQIWKNGTFQIRRFNEQTVSKARWTKLTGEFTCSASDIAADSIVFFVESDNNTADFYIDDLSLKESALFGNLAAAARLPSLKEAYQNYFLMGNIFSPEHINNAYLPFFKRHYDILTAENAMKPNAMTTAKDTYTFADVDAALKTISAEAKDMRTHGHTLLWDQSHADWLTNNADGTPLTRAEALQNMTDYIQTVAGHYAGQLYSWDVVNEAFAFWDENLDEKTATDWRRGLKDYVPWYRAFANGAKEGESGADYMETAFRLARQADPDAILYYNADNAEGQAHIAAVAAMVKDINVKWLAEGNTRLLIEGVGLQGHFGIDVDPDDVEQNIKRLVDLGVEISITELDIALYGWDENTDRHLSPTPELLKKQADLYTNLFLIFKKYSDNMARVTFWGLGDFASWIGTSFPLLFDEDIKPKLAYFAVVDPEGYLAGNFDTAGKREKWIRENSIAPNLDTASGWARDAIQSAVSKGFVPEDIQGDYQANITRAEFCRMAVMYIEYKTGRKIDGVLSEKGLAVDPKTFDDTGDPYILAAYALGVTSGTAPGQFNPGGQFDRQSAAQMIANVHAALGHDVSGPEPAGFADADKISPWTKAGVDYCAANGIMRGNDNQFDPAAPFSREMSVMTFDNMK